MTKNNRRRSFLVLALLAAVQGTAAFAQDKPATRPATTPASKAVERVVRVSAEHPETKERLICLVDVTAAPELEKWGTQAGNYALKHYATIEKALATDGYTPTREFRLFFKDMPGVAHASGNVITISINYVKRNPDDFGMVAHELTHVIQKYRRGEGWLTEGIADYVRYYIIEPGTRRARFDINKSTYKNAYQPAAGFLDYLERTNPGVVSKLNAALRAGKYKPELFVEVTGGTPDELWEKFKEAKK